MQKKYCFGLFFICLFCIAFVFFILLQNREMRRPVIPEMENEGSFEEAQLQEETASEVDTKKVKNTVKKNGYYAKIVDDYICIFQENQDCMFYQSDILAEDLPVDLQKELEAGKYFATELEVYYFLESYTS